MKSQKDAGLFALVTMETARDVTFCIKMLHNSYYRGQKLLVKKVLLNKSFRVAPRLNSSRL